MTPLVLDLKQAAGVIGVSEWTLRRFVAEGLIPTVRYPSAKRGGEDSRRILIAVADLEKFILRFREEQAS